MQALKESLAQAPALTNSNYELPVHIETAALETAMSAVLSHELHGQLRPISYASKLLSPVDMQYSTCEMHLLAILWAVKHFTYIFWALVRSFLHTIYMLINSLNLCANMLQLLKMLFRFLLMDPVWLSLHM